LGSRAFSDTRATTVVSQAAKVVDLAGIGAAEAQLAGTEAVLAPIPVSARLEHAFLPRVRRLPEETQPARWRAGSGTSAQQTESARGRGGSRRKIVVDDPCLEDRVADNSAKNDITETETLLFGGGFGVGTDIETGPKGDIFVVSLSNGAVYEIFRR
jgi:hypothetical protein